MPDRSGNSRCHCLSTMGWLVGWLVLAIGLFARMAPAPQIFQAVVSQGFALAMSSCSENGSTVKEGAQNSH